MTAVTASGVKVCAVIVTFHPDLAVLDALLESVLPQVAMAVLVDNGSPGADNLRLARQRLDLLLLDENQGLAAAQNRGINRAYDLGCSHVLLLDQDSIPAADMLARLLAAEERCLAKGIKVGVVGPRFIDPDTGAETWFHGRGLLRYRYLKGSEADPVVRADLLIASGMLIRVAVLTEVGGMDATLFIDLVDTEWCLRVAAAGYGVFGVSDALMYHRIGNRTVKVADGAGRRGTFPVHPPLRYYYMVRNSVLLTMNVRIPGWWKLNNGIELLCLFLLLPFVADRCIESLTMILKGVWDGLVGRRGSFTASA